MALINSQNRYIRILPDGTFMIYASEADRLREKNATKAEIIIASYDNLITALLADEERQYYDTESWDTEYSGLCNERLRYIYDLQNHILGNSYPLMAQHFPDIADSIPAIIESGSLVIGADNLYPLAKDRGYFGETEDA